MGRIFATKLQANVERVSPVWSVFDSVVLWAVSVFGAVAAFALLLTPYFFRPAEDAVILFQFSRNLAQTGAITYIPHGPHAEGATDFAWMVLISAAMKVHIPPYFFVACVNTISAFLLAYLLLRIAGRKLSLLPALFIIGAFSLMPQVFSALLGFSSLPFAVLLVLLAWTLIENCYIAMPVVALVLCLFRPDGVVFAVPALIAALVLYKGRRRALFMDFSLFVLPGLLYFCWRWHYFGQFLPLPFMVKSNAQRIGGYLVLSSLQESILLLVFCGSVLLVLLRGRLNVPINRVVLLCMVVLPNIFYWAMRLDQDVGYRFFIFIPIGTAILVAMNWDGTPSRALVLRTAALVWLICIFHTWGAQGHGSMGAQFPSRYSVADDLARIPHGKLLTTEAGIVPYYSGWPSYDAWGLNTVQFAKHLLQPADVAALNPDLVMAHTRPGGELDCIPHADWQTPYQERTWQNMSRNLIAGADPAHYDLWLVPRGAATSQKGVRGTDHDCWLVRKDSPLGQTLDAIMQRHEGLTLDQYQALLQSQSVATH